MKDFILRLIIVGVLSLILYYQRYRLAQILLSVALIRYLFQSQPKLYQWFERMMQEDKEYSVENN